MKKTILYGLVSSGVLLLAGCNEEWNIGGSGEGSFNPVVSLDTNSTGSRNSRSDVADQITENDLSLKLTPDDPKGMVRQWESLGDFNNQEKFNVGGYTLEAYYGDKNEEGFEKPYYYGAATFSVRENETTSVALTAQLGNAMVTPTYTDEFKNYFTNYSLEFKTLAGNSIKYAANENRPVYVAPGSVQLVVNVVKPNGTDASFQAATFVAEARHHYHITLNVNNGNVGEAFLTISFDDTMDKEDVIIDLSQDLTNTPAPVIKAEGFENGSTVNVVAGTTTENPLQVTISARGGLGSVMLTTKSTSLKEQGWPESFDLLAVPAAVQTTMESLGFTEIGLWRNPDKMAVIDLTNVLSNIKYITGFDNASSFTVTVTDKLSQAAEEPVVLNVTVEKLQLALIETEPVMYYSNSATVGVDYNGANPEKQISIQYKNNAGVWTNLKIEGTEVTSRALTQYSFKVSGLPEDAVYGERDVVIRAKAFDARGNELMTTPELTIKRTPVPFELAVSENNVFAHSATGVATHQSEPVADFLSGAMLEMSTDNGATYSEYDFSIEGDHVKITGLKDNTGYSARLRANGMVCKPVQFTTEVEQPIANGTFDGDTWSVVSSGKYWKEYGVQGWGTMNPLTVSSKNGTDGTTYTYVANSGTIPTEDGHHGQAALLKTVGWGAGNTAPANFIVKQDFGTCKNATAGELYLGTYDGGARYGIDFVSRPSGMTFYYKYIKKNSEDRGAALIRIRDTDGVIISEKELEMDNCESYSDATLQLDYPFDSSKASTIEIVFKSSNKDVNSQRNKDWLTPPPHNNLSDGEYIGSQLYIDDITLNY